MFLTYDGLHSLNWYDDLVYWCTLTVIKTHCPLIEESDYIMWLGELKLLIELAVENILNKVNNKITELRTIFQRESQNS
jgi:hypothetical protein